MSETIEDIVNYLRRSCEVADGTGSVLDGGELADRIEAAARPRRELLCRLRDDNIELKVENAKIRELVGMLTDELSKFHAWEEARALVAMAKEVAK